MPGRLERRLHERHLRRRRDARALCDDPGDAALHQPLALSELYASDAAERHGRGARDMSRAPEALRRLRGAQDGATALEFALVFPIVALFLIGGVEFGRLFWQRSS